LGGVTNLNIDAQIIDFTKSVFIPTVGEKVKNAGFTFHRYVVGDPFEGSRMRYSTVEINDGRQSLGIYNTFSFIIEGKRYADLTTKIRRRAEGQLTAMLSLLQTVAENKEQIMKIVSESRNQLLQESHTSPVWSDIQMEYFLDSTNAVLNFPIFNLHTWHHEIKELGNFHSLVRVKKSIEQPEGYVIPADQGELIKLLERHRIKMLPLQRDSLIRVEYYLLKHVTTRMEEEMELPYVDVRVKSELHKFGKGSVIVYLNQPARLVLPLILEPESSFSIVAESSGRKYQFDYLKERSVYPIFRLVK
ncbi:MAG: hypothetical protein P8184_16895, partial [Calditrichia bacterium]